MLLQVEVSIFLFLLYYHKILSLVEWALKIYSCIFAVSVINNETSDVTQKKTNIYY